MSRRTLTVSGRATRGAGSTEAVLLLVALVLAGLVVVTLFGNRLAGANRLAAGLLDGEGEVVAVRLGGSLVGDEAVPQSSPSGDSSADPAVAADASGDSPIVTGSDEVVEQTATSSDATTATSGSADAGATFLDWLRVPAQSPSDWLVTWIFGRGGHGYAYLAPHILAGPEAYRRYLQDLRNLIQQAQFQDPWQQAQFLEILDLMLARSDEALMSGGSLDLTNRLALAMGTLWTMDTYGSPKPYQLLGMLGDDLFDNGLVDTATTYGVGGVRASQFIDRLAGLEPGHALRVSAANHSMTIGRDAAGNYYLYDPTLPNDNLQYFDLPTDGSFPEGSVLETYLSEQGIVVPTF